MCYATDPSATLLASEPFASASGPLHGRESGFGWSGGWQVQNDSDAVPGYSIAVQNPLTSDVFVGGHGYALGGSNWLTAGRSFHISSSTMAPYVKDGLIGVPGRTLYFGFLFRKERDNNDESWVALHSGSSPPWHVTGSSVAIGYFGSTSNLSGVRYWSIRLNGQTTRSTIPLTVGKAALLVVRMDFGVTNSVSLFVDPPAAVTPERPAAHATGSFDVAFRSMAFYGGADSGQSSVDEIRLASDYAALVRGGTPPPEAPANLSATAGDSYVRLGWQASPGATAYRVYQVPDNGLPRLLSSVKTAGLVISGLANRTSYTFYVVATNESGASAPSTQVTAVPHGAAPSPRPSLGTNLSVLADWGREWPFVDAFRTARPWVSHKAGSPWGAGGPLALDADGWIQVLQPGQYAETIMFDNALGDRESYPTGDYTLLYEGEGKIEFAHQSARIVQQGLGRMVVNVPGGTNGIYLRLMETNPSNPLRKIRFIMPGFESTWQSQPFHPVFLDRLRGYKVIRFMEWMQTNGSTISEWRERPTVADYTYVWRGAPLEVMIQLANTLGANPWFNIPVAASDDFVRNFATMARAQLNPALHFYIEYSNETWNDTFSQAAYVRRMGSSLNFSSDPVIAGAAYTAHRSVQIFSIFRTVFGGSTARFVRVIASQAENDWLSDRLLSFRNAFASADALAIAPYFNCGDAASNFVLLGDPSTASKVAAMTVDEINNIQLAQINGCALRQITSNKAVADKYGIRLVAYEGGQSLVGFGGAENNEALARLFSTANRSSRMEQLYDLHLHNWVLAGGDLFVHYTNVAPNHKWGNFGSLEYQDQEPRTAPKHRSLMRFAAQYNSDNAGTSTLPSGRR